jgi:hypothetical protein
MHKRREPTLYRLVCPFPRRASRPVHFGAITLSTSPISSSAPRTTNQAHIIADKLTVEAKALADLKIEKAAVEGERRKVEAGLGPVRYLATLLGADNEAVLRWFILVVALARPGRGPFAAGGFVSAMRGGAAAPPYRTP